MRQIRNWAERVYPSGMKIPGRARCICFLDKYIHHRKGDWHEIENGIMYLADRFC